MSCHLFFSPDKNICFHTLIDRKGNQSDIWVKNVVIQCDRRQPNRGQKRADLISNPWRLPLHLMSDSVVRVCAQVKKRHTRHRLTFLFVLSKHDSHHISLIMCDLKQSVVYCPAHTHSALQTKVTLFPWVITFTCQYIACCLFFLNHSVKLYKG